MVSEVDDTILRNGISSGWEFKNSVRSGWHNTKNVKIASEMGDILDQKCENGVRSGWHNTNYVIILLCILCIVGQLHWMSTQDESEHNWAIVSGLVPGVIYEVRVVARNGDGEEGQETTSPVRKVRIGVRRGKNMVPYFQNSKYSLPNSQYNNWG